MVNLNACTFSCNCFIFIVYLQYSLLADDRLPVVTRHIIEAWAPLDNDRQTVLITLSIVWLTRAPSR